MQELKLLQPFLHLLRKVQTEHDRVYNGDPIFRCTFTATHSGLAGFCVTGLWGKIFIQTLPPLFIYLVIATRAASIWLLFIHAGSRACKPYSPYVIVLPCELHLLFSLFVPSCILPFSASACSTLLLPPLSLLFNFGKNISFIYHTFTPKRPYVVWASANHNLYLLSMSEGNCAFAVTFRSCYFCTA